MVRYIRPCFSKRVTTRSVVTLMSFLVFEQTLQGAMSPMWTSGSRQPESHVHQGNCASRPVSASKMLLV